ncbi:MAG: biopolymer transporter ExbD [Pseudomonadota bacterium]
MINFETTNPKKNLISLTPLIDVVFILLVFFMLATSFTKWHSIHLGFGEATNVSDIDKKGTLVEIVSESNYQIDGSIKNMPQIESIVRNKLKSNPEHFVLVQPRENVPLQELVYVMGQLSKLVGKNISVAKEQK